MAHENRNVPCVIAHYMIEPMTVLSPANLRKALIAECSVSLEQVAAEADTSVELVRRTVRPAKDRTDTPKVKSVKAILAHRLGKTVAELWPEDEPRLPDSESRTSDASNGGDR